MARKDTRFSVLMNKETVEKIDYFWKKNKFSSRNDFINYVVEKFFLSEFNMSNIETILKKIDNNSKQINITKSLLEQIYANMMFPKNENKYEDKNLEEFYKKIKINKYKFFD